MFGLNVSFDPLQRRNRITSCAAILIVGPARNNISDDLGKKHEVTCTIMRGHGNAVRGRIAWP
jgi:hypothetical protein